MGVSRPPFPVGRPSLRSGQAPRPIIQLVWRFDQIVSIALIQFPIYVSTQGHVQGGEELNL
jgi:hypothetical protein